MREAEPHEDEQEEDAVGVVVGPTERVPGRDQREARRDERQRGPTTVSTPIDEPRDRTDRERRDRDGGERAGVGVGR
jgi:hypothetical protein